MNHKIWRTFGALALASVALLFAALPIEGLTPELGSSRTAVVKHLMQGSLAHRYVGGYAEVLTSFVFLMAALLLARVLRGTTEWTGWLSSAIAATGAIYVASGLIVGFPAGAAAIYDGHHGASVQTVTALNDLRNFAYLLSVADLGVFTVCVGVAILATRTLPRWTGWAGVVVGLLCVVSVAGARHGAQNLGNMAQFAWWVALGVIALRTRRIEPATAPRTMIGV
jgi:hypothetical protein